MSVAEMLNHTFQHLLHVRYELSYTAVLESINSQFNFLYVKSVASHTFGWGIFIPAPPRSYVGYDLMTLFVNPPPKLAYYILALQW